MFSAPGAALLAVTSSEFAPSEAAKSYRNLLGATLKMVARGKEGRKPAVGVKTAAAPSEAARAMVRHVLLPPQRPAGVSGAGDQGGGVVVHKVINGYDKSPKEIADMAQRHISEVMNHKVNDFEPAFA